MKTPDKLPPRTLRNPYALAANSRKGGFFAHRCTPRGGAKNEQEEYLEIYDQDASENDPDE